MIINTVSDMIETIKELESKVRNFTPDNDPNEFTDLQLAISETLHEMAIELLFFEYPMLKEPILKEPTPYPQYLGNITLDDWDSILPLNQTEWVEPLNVTKQDLPKINKKPISRLGGSL